MIIFHNPSRRPGFGVSNRGYLIAAWTSGSDRLTIEFLPKLYGLMSRVDKSAAKIEDAENLLFPLSLAVGEDAETIRNSLVGIQERQTLNRPIHKLAKVEAADKSLPEKLYDALARVKLRT